MSLALSLAMLAAGPVFVADTAVPNGVSIPQEGRGDLMVGPSGTPLYTFDGNAGFNGDCQGDCLQAWPPLRAAPGDAPLGDWAPVRRSDGILQWAYKSSLVYSYAADNGPLRATGDGAANKWHALRFVGATPAIPVPPAAQVAKAGGKFRLADHRGLTLYTFTQDGRSGACTAECLEVWPPLLAPQLARPIGEWSAVERPDGLRQWAFRGQLVYRFSEDQLPGQAAGEGAGGAWTAIYLTGQAGPRGTAGEKR
jgi:predicted lipoprotein with Yx(FWY)xxD motif